MLSLIVLIFLGSCLCDELADFISPEDIELLSNDVDTKIATMKDKEIDLQDLPHEVECFGHEHVTGWIKFAINLKPMHPDDIEIKYYFHNRQQRDGVTVVSGKRFGLGSVRYDVKKPTVVIVHGFMSYGKAKWVLNMKDAFLNWGDINVITVDWSKSSKTWKYWRAVANTHSVGKDLAQVLTQVKKATGANLKNFHLIGHSLGAHICSFASNTIGKVKRITALDPAQPCFLTNKQEMKLDKSDAEFVDVIHTNGRHLDELGFGLPDKSGHQDFYVNGGGKQPGCDAGDNGILFKLLKLKRAICNHGRAYLVFTESLKKNRCVLIGHTWDMQYSGVNKSILAPCNPNNCAELGINAIKSPARGPMYVITSESAPYCDVNEENGETRTYLLDDLHRRARELIGWVISKF